MRGTPVFVGECLAPEGIIPAYAGNTLIRRRRWRRRRDHPRVCGEHRECLAVLAGGLGSSPRMRGTPCKSCRLRCPNGIIPAYAGNTVCLPVYSPCLRDHPRVCGEHMASSDGSETVLGSSPRMRGTPDLHNRFVVCIGIIPAYAGNTEGILQTPECLRDHPRVCGEHPYRIIPIPEDMGSSPRMRGTRVMQCDNRACGGIIPAYAGNTMTP